MYGVHADENGTGLIRFIVSDGWDGHYFIRYGRLPDLMPDLLIDLIPDRITV